MLFEPRGGRLEAGVWVRFRVRVPGARRVSVVGGEGKVELKTNKSRVWEGEAFTGAARQVQLAAAAEDGGDMAVLLAFDVGPSEE